MTTFQTGTVDNITLNDFVLLEHIRSAGRTWNVSIIDTLTISDDDVLEELKQTFVSSTVTLSDSVTTSRKSEAALDTLTLSDVVATQQESEGVVDSIILSDVVVVQQTWEATIIGGSGTGRYLEGETVEIEAAQSNFIAWTGNIEALTNRASPVESFLMPAGHVTLIALYDTAYRNSKVLK